MIADTFRLRSTRAALIVSAVVSLLSLLTPILGTPGIESALVLGLLLPPFAGAIGVRVVAQGRAREAPLSLGDAIGAAMLASATLVAIPALVMTLNMLRVPVCAPLEGFGFILLGPGFAVALSTLVGVAIGAAVPRVRLATTLAVLAPIAWDLYEVLGFYSTPAVYAYGHFVGYFPGTLYDPDITITATYASYRALTMVWWIGVAASALALWDPDAERPRIRRVLARPALASAAVAFVLAAILGEVNGDSLGHWSTPDTLRHALGGSLNGETCEVVYPRETPRRDAERLLSDCEFRIARAEQVLGVHQAHHVTAFFFRSAEEKRALMGASHTYVAKPWRNEVYLQIGEWPHPVLFHEITHVVAGNLGPGPFAIAGSLGGFLPSPAIIEGTAVAVAWGEHDGLTPHQWARAMVDEGLAPPLSSVEGLAFLLQPASRAYTVSGSFVRWMMDTEGSASVRRLYLYGWDEALGRPLEEAEADWRRFLAEQVDLPPEARALARARFEAPGIFGQICPHAIANLTEELRGSVAAGDDRTAQQRCEAILALDAGQAGTRAALVGVLARRGQLDRANEELAQLVGPPSAARPIVWHAQQSLADALFWQVGADAALPIYEALLEEPMDADARRQIEVRRLATASDRRTQVALREMLIPPVGRTSDAATVMDAIEQLGEARDDGLADYLAARQLGFRQRFELALPRLVRGRERGLPSASMDREARRMEGAYAFGAGDLDRSAERWREVLRDDPSPGEEDEALDWLARIRFTRGRE